MSNYKFKEYIIKADWDNGWSIKVDIMKSLPDIIADHRLWLEITLPKEDKFYAKDFEEWLSIYRPRMYTLCTQYGFDIDIFPKSFYNAINKAKD